jgi:hypothetical protein
MSIAGEQIRTPKGRSALQCQGKAPHGTSVMLQRIVIEPVGESRLLLWLGRSAAQPTLRPPFLLRLSSGRSPADQVSALDAAAGRCNACRLWALGPLQLRHG